MWIFELFGWVYEWAQAWRFSLCSVGGFGLGFLILMSAHAGRFQTWAGILIIAAFNGVGVFWEMSARNRRSRP